MKISYYKGDEILFYSSEKFIVVFIGNEFIQLLNGHEKEITFIDTNSLGLVVSCSNDRICIHEPVENEGKFAEQKTTWELTQTLWIKKPLECLNVNVFGKKTK
jgi:hypothetical protein